MITHEEVYNILGREMSAIDEKLDVINKKISSIIKWLDNIEKRVDKPSNTFGGEDVKNE